MGLGPVGFDLDMTLIDSRPAIMAAFAAVSRDTGTRIGLDQVDSRLGIKLEDELGFWFPPEAVPAGPAATGGTTSGSRSGKPPRCPERARRSRPCGRPGSGR